MTIKDIARKVGTSASTVSRVVNGLNIRDKDLARRILETAAELDYQPNEAGRRLRTGVDAEYGPVFEVRSREDLEAKRAIADKAAGLVQPSDVVVLDSGTTVAQMAYVLPTGVIVYTNSLAALQPLAKRGIPVHVAPGLYVPAMAAVFGPETEAYFASHGSSVYFLSSARVDVRTGLFNLHPSTYGVKRVALEHARRKILLVHHDKFCDSGLTAFAPLTAVDLVVTDFVPPAFREPLAQAGVQVLETARERATAVERGGGEHA